MHYSAGLCHASQAERILRARIVFALRRAAGGVYFPPYGKQRAEHIIGQRGNAAEFAFFVFIIGLFAFLNQFVRVYHVRFVLRALHRVRHAEKRIGMQHIARVYAQRIVVREALLRRIFRPFAVCLGAERITRGMRLLCADKVYIIRLGVEYIKRMW